MPATIESKILNRKEVASRLARRNRSGRRLSLANGCFDILHVGHIRYLESAKREADLLLVGINADASVRRLKGEGRPIQCEADRAEVIAALRCVDYVTIFPEDTVIPLIQTVAPDVHCKGTDYTEETVPEADAVRRAGGRVAIVGDPKDHDTSEILARLDASRS